MSNHFTDFVELDPFLVGDDLTVRAPDLEQLRANQAFLYDAPALTVIVRSAEADQSIDPETDHAIEWSEAVVQGPGGQDMWDPADPADVVCQREGNYLITAAVSWNDLGADPEDSETTDREVRLRVDNDTRDVVCGPAARSGTAQKLAVATYLEAGHTVRVLARHLSSEGPIAGFQVSGSRRTRMSLRWIGQESPGGPGAII